MNDRLNARQIEADLTDEMIDAIKAYFPRYPSQQAVTLPALHIVNDKLRCVPRQAVVEIAELLDLARRGARHAHVLRLLQAGQAARPHAGCGSAAD